jgi:hypothetical protein
VAAVSYYEQQQTCDPTLDPIKMDSNETTPARYWDNLFERLTYVRTPHIYSRNMDLVHTEAGAAPVGVGRRTGYVSILIIDLFVLYIAINSITSCHQQAVRQE